MELLFNYHKYYFEFMPNIPFETHRLDIQILKITEGTITIYQMK